MAARCELVDPFYVSPKSSTTLPSPNSKRTTWPKSTSTSSSSGTAHFPQSIVGNGFFFGRDFDPTLKEHRSCTEQMFLICDRGVKPQPPKTVTVYNWVQFWSKCTIKTDVDRYVAHWVIARAEITACLAGRQPFERCFHPV